MVSIAQADDFPNKINQGLANIVFGFIEVLKNVINITHPDAAATVIASTDTVGKPAYNQDLSERRANTVIRRLISSGAKRDQLIVKPIGEASGADNTPNQENRVVTIITSHPDYIDCPNLK